MMEVTEFLDEFWHGLLHIKIQLPFVGESHVSHVHNPFLPSSSFPSPISSSSSLQMCQDFPSTTFHILVTHLNPQSSVTRLQETESIVQISNRILDLERRSGREYDGGNIILLGDFNTLSPTEDFDFLFPLLSSQTPLARKFLSPINGQIDLSPYLSLTSLFTDIFPIPMRHSVPTQFTPDPMHACPLRLDYAMVTSNVRRLFDTTLTIVDDDVTNTLSDHFPLLLTMRKRREEEESHLYLEVDKEEL